MDIPSFKIIQSECEQIIQQLRVKLRIKIIDPLTSPSVIIEAVNLLISLGDSAVELRESYLNS